MTEIKTTKKAAPKKVAAAKKVATPRGYAKADRDVLKGLGLDPSGRAGATNTSTTEGCKLIASKAPAKGRFLIMAKGATIPATEEYKELRKVPRVTLTQEAKHLRTIALAAAKEQKGRAVKLPRLSGYIVVR